MTLQKLLYGRRNTAQLLDVSLRTVDYLTEAGKLETVKIGRRTLIKADSIGEFCKTNQPRIRHERTEETVLVPGDNLETRVNA